MALIERIQKEKRDITNNEKVIVITAGGTMEPIDSVRSIRNSSSGKLGAKVAGEMRKEFPTAEILYYANRHAIRPEVEHTWIETTSVLDVKEKLEHVLTTQKVDIVIHSMAVADYFVEGIELPDGQFIEAAELQSGKLSSTEDEMKVILKKAPKIISLIKQWQPYVYLVGFKLLDDVSEERLFEVGFDLLRKNRCNLVVANDLSLIREGKHEGMFIFPEKKFEKALGKERIAKELSKLIAMRAFCKHSQSIALSEDSEIRQSLLDEMKSVGDTLYQKGLLPDVEGGTYGNLSVRDGEEFYITGRNVHKGNLNESIVCRIESCEEVDEESVYAYVRYHGKVKPSIDSAIHAKIYDKLPKVKAILHVHTDDLFNRPLSSYNYPCGTMEERDSIVELMTNKTSIIQMKKHGVIIVGDSLTESLEKWEALMGEFVLKPLQRAEKHPELWAEWVDHINFVGGVPVGIESDMLNPKNYYTLHENGETYGLCYLKVTKDEVVFSLYTSTDYQKSGKGIGGETIQILKQVAKSESRVLVLVTKPLCGVEDYYKKQGFTTMQRSEQQIKMIIT